MIIVFNDKDEGHPQPDVKVRHKISIGCNTNETIITSEASMTHWQVTQRAAH